MAAPQNLTPKPPAAKVAAPAETSAPTTPAAEAPKKRGRKPGSQNGPRPIVSGLSVDFLKAPARVSHEEIRRVAPQRERSDVQKAVDATIPGLHKEWVDGGRKTVWAEMPVAKYHVNPDQVQGLKYLIRRGADLYGFRVRFGSPIMDPEGREIVSFVVLDRTAKDDAPTAAAPAEG